MGNRMGNLPQHDDFNDRVIADASCTDVNASGEKTEDEQTDNGNNVLVATSNSNGVFATDPNRDQPDSAGEDGSVYVQVTILSEKLGIKEDGTILLNPLSESLISNYCELSDCHNSCDDSTLYYLKHNEHQFGICEPGPLKQVSARTPSECRKINITGLFSDCTMSNESDKLYLKAKAEPISKVKVVKKAKGNSHLYVQVLGRTPSGGLLCYVFLAEDKSLAFKFDKDSREVMIDKYNRDSKSFKFDLSFATKELPKVNFVENC